MLKKVHGSKIFLEFLKFVFFLSIIQNPILKSLTLGSPWEGKGGDRCRGRLMYYF